MARETGLDLAGSDEIQAAHLAKAMYCPRFSIGQGGKAEANW